MAIPLRWIRTLHDEVWKLRCARFVALRVREQSRRRSAFFRARLRESYRLLLISSRHLSLSLSLSMMMNRSSNSCSIRSQCIFVAVKASDKGRLKGWRFRGNPFLKYRTISCVSAVHFDADDLSLWLTTWLVLTARSPFLKKSRGREGSERRRKKEHRRKNW